MSTTEKTGRVTGDKAEALCRLHDAALMETIEAIGVAVATGKKPERSRRAQLSKRENGMPSISDAPLFERNGPLKYSSVLEPPFGDEVRRAKGKYPESEFPAMAELVDFVTRDSEVSAAYMEKPLSEMLTIMVQLGVESAADLHFLRFGEVGSSQRTRQSVLRGVLTGLMAERLDTPVVVPIALVRFDFDRVRLSDGAILVRMSDGLQRARWSGKAWGASGHESVLSAATHALILTGWGRPNSPKFQLYEALSRPSSAISAEVELFFAALRLELGIETGYAQELRLAKGWCTQAHLGDPEVFAVAARRYPAWFDDFGWNTADLPLVDGPAIARVAATWGALKNFNDPRMALALRRLNAAMTREEPADVILDATIAMEVLLGDGDGQSISWKLRMRGAALVGMEQDRASMSAMFATIKQVYEARSSIVHGGKKSSKGLDERDAADKAIGALRTIMKCLVAHPEFIDPLRIDAELLLTPTDEKLVALSETE